MRTDSEQQRSLHELCELCKGNVSYMRTQHHTSTIETQDSLITVHKVPAEVVVKFQHDYKLNLSITSSPASKLSRLDSKQQSERILSTISKRVKSLLVLLYLYFMLRTTASGYYDHTPYCNSCKNIISGNCVFACHSQLNSYSCRLRYR